MIIWVFLPACADVTVSFLTYTSVTFVHVTKDTVTSAQAGRNLSKSHIFIFLISSNFDASFITYLSCNFCHERHSWPAVISKCNKDTVSSLHPKLSFCDLFWKAPWNEMSVMFTHFLKAPQILYVMTMFRCAIFFEFITTCDVTQSVPRRWNYPYTD